MPNHLLVSLLSWGLSDSRLPTLSSSTGWHRCLENYQGQQPPWAPQLGLFSLAGFYLIWNQIGAVCTNQERF